MWPSHIITFVAMRSVVKVVFVTLNDKYHTSNLLLRIFHDLAPKQYQQGHVYNRQTYPRNYVVNLSGLVGLIVSITLSATAIPITRIVRWRQWPVIKHTLR